MADTVSQQLEAMHRATLAGMKAHFEALRKLPLTLEECEKRNQDKADEGKE